VIHPPSRNPPNQTLIHPYECYQQGDDSANLVSEYLTSTTVYPKQPNLEGHQLSSLAQKNAGLLPLSTASPLRGTHRDRTQTLQNAATHQTFAIGLYKCSFEASLPQQRAKIAHRITQIKQQKKKPSMMIII
jgi:hypothetical protein